jgi:hypothetical protein
MFDWSACCVFPPQLSMMAVAPQPPPPPPSRRGFKSGSSFAAQGRPASLLAAIADELGRTSESAECTCQARDHGVIRIDSDSGGRGFVTRPERRASARGGGGYPAEIRVPEKIRPDGHRGLKPHRCRRQHERTRTDTSMAAPYLRRGTAAVALGLPPARRCRPSFPRLSRPARKATSGSFLELTSEARPVPASSRRPPRTRTLGSASSCAEMRRAAPSCPDAGPAKAPGRGSPAAEDCLPRPPAWVLPPAC